VKNVTQVLKCSCKRQWLKCEWNLTIKAGCEAFADTFCADVVRWFLVKSVPPDVRFLGLKCAKFDFRWGSAQATALRHASLLYLMGPTSKGE